LTGFQTATSEQLPDAVAVMDPFRVVRLAGDALDQCRRRVQQDSCGHRGRAGDPLYAARRTLHTGADLLTDKQRASTSLSVSSARVCERRPVIPRSTAVTAPAATAGIAHCGAASNGAAPYPPIPAAAHTALSLIQALC